MGRKPTGKKVMSVRVYKENESELKKMVVQKDKELKVTSLSKTPQSTATIPTASTLNQNQSKN